MDTEFVETELNGVKLRVFKDGTIMRYCEKGRRTLKTGWTIASALNSEGYVNVNLNNKCYKHHRIMGLVYLGLDIDDKQFLIDHIDRDRTNNHITNLRIVTKHENQFNRTCKGYYFKTETKNYCSQIRLNNKLIHVGYFNTEDEARNAYLEAKAKYHIILPHPNPHLHPK